MFADDTQIYISFKTTDIASAKQRVEDCVTEIGHWMNINKLKLNEDKTDILLIHSRYHNKPSVDEFNIELEKVPVTATSVKSLGVSLDEHMIFDGYVAEKCKSSFYHLRNLSRIRKYLTRETAAIVVHAFVTSKLDYCNSFLFGLPKYQMRRLQNVQNTAARIACRIGKYERITPVLVDLHWLPVYYRIVFKILLLVYKSINGMSPGYLICCNFANLQGHCDLYRMNYSVYRGLLLLLL